MSKVSCCEGWHEEGGRAFSVIHSVDQTPREQAADNVAWVGDRGTCLGREML
jgi:hypothetical protein